MKRISIALVLLVVAVTATAKMRTNIVFDGKPNFSAFQSYGWRSAHDEKSGHALAEGQPLEKELRALADADLQQRGLVEKTDGTPDFWLVFLGYAAERMWVDGVNHQLSTHIEFASEGGLISEMEGTLILEVFDGESEELLWSALASDVAGSRKALLRKGPKALKKILKLLPAGR